MCTRIGSRRLPETVRKMPAVSPRIKAEVTSTLTDEPDCFAGAIWTKLNSTADMIVPLVTEKNPKSIARRSVVSRMLCTNPRNKTSSDMLAKRTITIKKVMRPLMSGGGLIFFDVGEKDSLARTTTIPMTRPKVPSKTKTSNEGS
jgi:hypothetical protein